MMRSTRGAANELARGATVGKNARYEVRRLINRGGTALVYEGIDRDAGVGVALKCIDVGATATVKVPLRAVKREIKYATRLMASTTRVVRLLDVVHEGEDLLVLVFELARGVDVLDYVNDSGGRLDEIEARRLFAQLVEAIRTIHDHGLCHRDIKPENAIACEPDGDLKLIDFGLAKGLESVQTRAVGTPDYMAPEMLDKHDGEGNVRCERYDAKACDVWSCGVFCYIMLTGNYPFQNAERPNNVKATLENIVKGNITPMPRAISNDVKDLILGMLQPDPKKRMTLREVSRHPWVLAGSSRGAGGRKMSLVERLKKTFRRSMTKTR
jgi:serine/threonine protein kinase